MPAGQWPFEAIARDLLAAGIGSKDMVGAEDSYLFDAARVVDFATSWIESKLA